MKEWVDWGSDEKFALTYSPVSLESAEDDKMAAIAPDVPS
jgi:hypothetical protein